jgi:4'-phosphopantetheinyl transferase
MPEGWRSHLDWTPLTEDAVDVWRLDLTVTEEDWEILSPDESERARRIVREGKRSQKASSRAQLRRILALYVDSEPASLRFEYGEHGKPQLADHMDLSFNLSHSEKVGLVGVSRGVRIGIDVEHARIGRDFSGLALRFFSPAESTALERLPEAERPSAFYRAWTCKEAYLKALGTGLSFPSNAFTIEYAAGGPGRVTATDMPGDHPETWCFSDVDVSPDFAGAVCLEGPERSIRWWGPGGDRKGRGP